MPRKPPACNPMSLLRFPQEVRAVVDVRGQALTLNPAKLYSIVKEPKDFSRLQRFERVPGTRHRRLARIDPAAFGHDKPARLLYHDSAALDTGERLADARHSQLGPLR